VACPYFYPVERFDDQTWAKPPRLPLGDPCRGTCRARAEESAVPDDATLRDFCNLGYARDRCSRFPADGEADAIRFSVSGETNGVVSLIYIFEKQWSPAKHGSLEYPLEAHDALTRQAQVFAESYLSRRVSAPRSSSDPST